jgi:hypothetical protein
VSSNQTCLYQSQSNLNDVALHCICMSLSLACHSLLASASLFRPLRCVCVQAIMERERGTPTFSFLFDLQSPLHHYYRWRVFSFAQGDTLTRWRVDPFVMVQGGPRWLPPPLPEDSSDKKQEPPTAAGGKGKVRPPLGRRRGAGNGFGHVRKQSATVLIA